MSGILKPLSFYSKGKPPKEAPVLLIRIVEQLGDFFKEVGAWLHFLSTYFRKHLFRIIRHFESAKDIIVSFLTIKRGRYSKHFLNISFVFLVAAAVIVGPVLAEYYPTVKPDVSASESASEVTVSGLSQEDVSTTTQFSDKVRFDIVDYEVVPGDTLGSVADKFGVSIDTIKWANSLKGEKLVPGQTLRILPVTGIAHKVNSGDSIYSIAKKYKTDAQKIVNFPANDFADLDTFSLSVGQIVYVPDGVAPESAAVYKPVPLPQQPAFIAGSGGKFQWPTQGIITQYPVSYHMAVDIANPSAPPVVVSDNGTVSYAGCIRYGYGCHIIINHADGFQTLYGHLSVIGVNVGATVGRGQVIGRMGSTGRSSGTHLHFEIRKNGVLLNPLGFLSK